MSPEPAWRASRRKRAELALIAGLGYPLLAALGSTYRYVVDGLEHLHAAEALGHPIHAFWHGRILPGTVYFKRRGIVVITSENFDGEWIARIITKFGYGTARGSSSRGALKAMLQLLRDVKDRPVAFTLDGPRGPARVAQPGALWLSKATGQSDHPVPSRSRSPLDDEELGSVADSETVCARRPGVCAADGRAARHRRRCPRRLARAPRGRARRL